MFDRDISESRSPHSSLRANFLPFEPLERGEASLVEQFGREIADLGMEPPRLIKEEALFFPNGLATVEHVVESRGARAFRVRAPRRLVELPWIAQKHQRWRRVRH